MQPRLVGRRLRRCSAPHANHARPTTHRRTRAVAFALGSVLATGIAVVVPIVPAEAEPTEMSEVHRFAPSDGAKAGYSSHIRGDYAIYTRALGSAVDIAHWVGPDRDNWEVATLQAPATGVGFGTAVRLDEQADRAFVSAKTNNSVYVYARTGANTWALDSTLTPPGSADRVSTYGGFGESLDVRGDRLVVSVPNATVDAKYSAGFVFLVDLATHAWKPLIPATVVANSITGQSVALDAGRLAVSAVQRRDAQNRRTGGVYLWDLSGTGGEPLFTSQPDTSQVCLSTTGGGAAFGMSLAFSAGVLFVGSPLEINYSGEDPTSDVDGCTDSAVEAGNTTQGAVYRFDSQLHQIGPKLVPPSGSYSFGHSIAVDGDALLASSEHGPSFRGEVRVYDVDGLATGAGDSRERVAPAQTLVASDAADGGGFGQQIYGAGMSVSGSRALIAAPTARSGAGEVYLFEPIIPDTAIALTMEDTTIEYGQQARLAAVISSSSTEVSDATGTVTFSVDGVALPPVPVNDGAASLLLDAASHQVGTHAEEAVFSADGNGVAARTESTLTVQPAATTTTLSATPATAKPGDTVTLTGKVTAAHGTVPTGNVKILVNGAVAGTAPLDAAGTYEWKVVPAKTGTLAVRAEYPGDANHLASAAKDPVVRITEPTSPEEVTPSAPGTGAADGGAEAPGGGAGPAQGRSGSLPTTGAQVLPLVMAAAVLLLIGTGALALRRRRVG